MPEKSVIFRDSQELSSEDLNNQQTWLGSSLDHVVMDAIEPGKKYIGFTISKSAQTAITLTPGRLYAGGLVYARDEPVVIDMFNDLPVVTKRVIAIVAWGQSINTDVQPRDFLIDANTGQSQPQSVAMTSERHCEVSPVRGVEAAQPQTPPIDANVLLIGTVTLDPTGIVSFTQNVATQLDNIGELGMRTTFLEGWRSVISGQVETLRTDLAALARQMLNYVTLIDFQKLVDIVDELYKKMFQPGVYVWYGTDYFLNTDQSDVLANVDGLYAAEIDEGLRFVGAGAKNTAGSLALLNPSDPFVLLSDGFLLPRPSGSRVRHDCAFEAAPWIEDRILQYVFYNFNCRHLTRSRWRFRYGAHFTPCPPAQVWWYASQLDPTYHILSFVDETWETTTWGQIGQHPENNVDWPRHFWDRDKYYWRDYVDLPHWAKVTTTFAHSGQHVCQTFLNSQDGWLTSVTIYLMSPSWHPLTLVIAGTNEQGEPNHVNHTIARVVLDGAALQAASLTAVHVGDVAGALYWGLWGITGGQENTPTWGWTAPAPTPLYVYPVRIDIPPTFLAAGQRYGLHLISTYDHGLAICDLFDAYQVHQGHYWTSHDTGLVLWPGNITPRSLRFKLHFATWARWAGQPTNGGGLRYEINLEPLQLAGGIGGIEVLAEHIIPPCTDVSYQVQIAGVWTPLSADPTGPNLAGNPALLPFRVVMTGTTDLMPGISLTPSEVTLHRNRSNTFHHISKSITLGGASTHIKVIAKILHFVTAHHTCVASLHYGATHKMADVIEDAILPTGELQRTWTFNTASITAVVVEIDGTTDGVGDNFVVAQEIRFATA